jgi:uncharacterized membrane protein YdjX (TVP38/TMEM64 family)
VTLATNQKKKQPFHAGQQDYYPRLQDPYPHYTQFQQVWRQSIQRQISLLSLEKWLAICLFCLAFLAIIWWGREPIADITAVLSNQEIISTYLKQYGALGPIVLAVAQLIQVLVAFIPGHVFLIAGGYVYGLLPGFLMNLTFVVTASQIAFMIARWTGRPFVNKIVSQTMVDKWEKIVEEKGMLFFTIAFVLPVFPTDVMNFVAGLSGISPRKFFIANLFGRMPGIMMLTLIGSHGLSLPKTVWIILGVVVTAVYLIGRRFISRIEAHYAN